ncbi:MAG: phosphatase PAP2 family protein [Verrucomicrobia bacterium]|nr:phosphatase PAP2 family protein [Verrucomicrobiota bacterium]
MQLETARSWKSVLALLAGLAALSGLVHARALVAFDLHMARWIHDCGNTPLDWAMNVLTMAGNPEFNVIAALALAGVFARRSGWRAGGWLFGIFVAATLIELVMKNHVFQPGVRGEFHRYVFREGLISISLPYAYPSGHTLRAVFLGGIMAHWIAPGTTKVWWTLAALVAISRVYLGSHWTTDVLGGVLLGVASLLALEKLVPTRAAPCSPKGCNMSSHG